MTKKYKSIDDAVREYTPEQWARWANYKSNKDQWIEDEERKQDECEHVKAYPVADGDADTRMVCPDCGLEE